MAEADVWQPEWLRRGGLFAPLAAAAAYLQGGSTWPTLAEFNHLAQSLQLRTAAGHPLRFVAAPPKPRGGRRRRLAREQLPSYEERVHLSGEVETRLGSWHDLFNALVWATFPASKAALNHRQAELRSPGAGRSREEDRLAMADEGGIILVGQAGSAVLFGHALYESMVYGQCEIYGMSYAFTAADPAVFASWSKSAQLAAIDQAFAAHIARGGLWQPPAKATRAYLPDLQPFL